MWSLLPAPLTPSAAGAQSAARAAQQKAMPMGKRMACTAGETVKRAADGIASIAAPNAVRLQQWP